jgi:hypothetical protein
MNGVMHRTFAASLWPATATMAGAPLWQVLAGIPVAAAFSAGPTSPDVDNTMTWKKIDKWVQDEILGEGGPLGHRRIMHWWGIPAILALIAHQADLGSVGWAVWAALLGWASHILADGICGRGGRGIPQGVPIAPWWWHIGAGLYSDRIGSAVVLATSCTACWWVVAGMPGA